MGVALYDLVAVHEILRIEDAHDGFYKLQWFTRTFMCFARYALRIFVMASEIGSVTLILPPLPARPLHAGDQAFGSQLAKAKTAKTKGADVTARATTEFAARVFSNLEFRLSLLFFNQ
jgi:hypothetical protein